MQVQGNLIEINELVFWGSAGENDTGCSAVLIWRVEKLGGGYGVDVSSHYAPGSAESAQYPERSLTVQKPRIKVREGGSLERNHLSAERYKASPSTPVPPTHPISATPCHGYTKTFNLNHP